MFKPQPQMIEGLLQTHGFSMEVGQDEFIFSRASTYQDLFERIEITLAGRHSEVMVIGLGIAVVRFARVQRQGLVIRENVAELCDSPDSAKVRIESKEHWRTWVQRVVDVAPHRVRELAPLRGPKLLADTSGVRARCSELFHRFIGRGDHQIDLAGLPSDTRRRVLNLLAKDLVVRIGLELECETVVAALVLGADPRIIELADSNVVPLHTLGRLAEVPDAFYQQVSLLLDMILRARVE